MLGALGHFYAVARERRLCQEILERLRGLSPGRYVSPIEFALISHAAGERDSAFEWLGRAVKDRSFELVCINVDPNFDAWRRDPRFSAVVAALGLSPPARRAAPALQRTQSAANNCSISSSLKPPSRRISRVCSPSAGAARAGSGGEALNSKGEAKPR